MHIQKRTIVYRSLICAAALVAAACQEREAPTAAPEAGASGQGATILYQESFGDGGLLTLAQDSAGRTGYAVQSPIGTDAETLVRASSSLNGLAEVYRALRGPGAALPAEVAEAASREEAAAVTAKPMERVPFTSTAKVPLAKAGAAEGSTSWEDFHARYCHDIRDGGFVYKNVMCVWDPNGIGVSNDNHLNSDGYLIDRSYGWNATPYTATMVLSSQFPGQPSPNGWQPTIPPYSVIWVQWGGVYESAVGNLWLPKGKRGEVGITTHWATANPK